jgi:hypothetical protein
VSIYRQDESFLTLLSYRPPLNPNTLGTNIPPNNWNPSQGGGPSAPFSNVHSTTPTFPPNQPTPPTPQLQQPQPQPQQQQLVTAAQHMPQAVMPSNRPAAVQPKLQFHNGTPFPQGLMGMNNQAAGAKLPSNAHFLKMMNRHAFVDQAAFEHILSSFLSQQKHMDFGALQRALNIDGRPISIFPLFNMVLQGQGMEQVKHPLYTIQVGYHH